MTVRHIQLAATISTPSVQHTILFPNTLATKFFPGQEPQKAFGKNGIISDTNVLTVKKTPSDADSAMRTLSIPKKESTAIVPLLKKQSATNPEQAISTDQKKPLPHQDSILTNH
jgi:hypothetical protein